MQKSRMYRIMSSVAIVSSIIYFTGVSISSAADINAKELYMTHCKTCHGAEGKPTDLGEGLGARDFTDAQWQAKITDEKIIKQITEGSEGKMFPFKDKLNAEEIKAMVPVVRSFGKK